MQAQLRVFDEQLAMLEEILGPLAEWGSTWAESEGLVTGRAVTRGLRASADPAAVAYFLAAMAWSTVW
jgi:hypothetical protein